MGTSNFYSKNARHTFAVLMNQDYQTACCEVCFTEYDSREYHVDKLPKSCCQTDLDWEDKVHYPERYEIDDFKDNIRDFVKEKYPNLYTESDGTPNDDNRNYSGTNLFELSKSREFMGCQASVGIIACIRSGYYEGCNLDYTYYINLEGWDYDRDSIVEELIAERLAQHGVIENNGLAKSNAPLLVRWLENTYDELTNLMEEIFSDFTEVKLVKTAQFSDGTAMYEQVK